MNERIKDLALKAGAGEWGDSVIPAMMDIEKFAELIVRECITVVDECNDVIISKYPNAFGYFVDDDPIANIKEHFGVE